MSLLRLSAVVLLVFLLARGAQADDRVELDKAVQQLSATGWKNAQQIWEWAEPGYQETKSSALLADWLESSGFRVQRGVAGIPTAFTAEYGSGTPVIALLGEFDALPGLSQSSAPFREPVEGQQCGQGCGHHLFGVASAMAAIALSQQMHAGKLQGTIRYYGCPAEEGGSGKVFLVRQGLFKDVAVALHWHPGSVNTAGDRSSLARIAVRFRFHGVSAHASAAPEQGRSALDAVEVTNFAANLMREHMPEQARMHYVITVGGDAPNVVPSEAEVYYYIRHPSSEVVRQLYQRLVKCAEAGALATETRLEVVNEGGILELLPNAPLAEHLNKRLEKMLDLKIAPQELELAQRLQATLSQPQPLASVGEISHLGTELNTGSTDVGDVSWVVPTAGFTVACWVPGTPGHSWQAVACGKTDLARQGMILAAKVLANTVEDLMTSPDLIAAARQDFQRRTGNRAYAPLTEPDQKPPLDYRKRRASSP
ncbi:amidohydrolase [Planctomicrobium piriforme]|uniref:Aminobenzoyl-glutamate utilization protein B n=1 Tax=Planctomicrobium piriforme TaxID=1576369 RepID=A0A1I3AU26_9PLAN|nr:amidohydrolase [Planctomicrobium piriforme]SFH53513.1 aminobenzoyl-glutamate utilization protein B [Planctomicrobium piriforme]